MKSDHIIYGKLELNEKIYPFFMQGQRATIIQIPIEDIKDFYCLDEVDRIVGVTNSNKIIALMNCRFSNSSKIALPYAGIVFSVAWYVEYDTEDLYFDKVCFTSSALNAFFPTIKAIDLGTHNEPFNTDGSYEIRIRPEKETMREFTSTINGESVAFKLGIAWAVSQRLEDSQIGKKYCECSLTFDSTKEIDSLSEYYLWLYDFLVFITFRQCVVVDKIILLKKNDKGSYKKVGSAYFFSRHQGYEAKTIKTITYDDVGEECIGRLFANVAMRRNDNRLNTLYVPETDEQNRTVDAVRWLSVALAFEGEFNAHYPNYKYQADENFRSAKEKLITTIDEQIKLSGKSKNNKVNSGYKRFRHLIDTTDTTLEEKFNLMFEQHGAVVQNVQKRYMQANQITDTNQQLASRWAEFRNSIAHGSLEPIDGRDIVNYALTKMFIYILVLEASGIDRARQQAIIEKIF